METNQAYVFTNDDPLNAGDPLGLEELPFVEGGGGGALSGPLSGILDDGEIASADVSSADSIRANLSMLDEGLRKPNVTVDNVEDLQKFFSENSKGGKIVYDDGGSAGGILKYELPDGTTIQYRDFSNYGGATIEIKFPDSPKILKVHILK